MGSIAARRLNGCSIDIVAEGGNRTVLAPGSTNLQEVKPATCALHELLLGDGVTEGYAIEVTPAVVDRKNRAVGCVSTEVVLNEVLSIVVVGSTAEVGELADVGGLATRDALRCGFGSVRNVPEVGFVLQDTIVGVAAVGASRYAVVAVLAVGATDHKSEVMNAVEGLVPVGEVLPLVVNGVDVTSTEVHVALVRLGAAVVVAAYAVGLVVAHLIAETRGDDHVRNGSEVERCGTVDVEYAGLGE